MKVCQKALVRGVSSRVALLGAAMALLAAGWAGVVRAQSEIVPSLQIQYATVTGSGNTITATRIPVLIGSGKTVYKDAVIQFATDSDGNIDFMDGSPQFLDSPNLAMSGFRAGNYAGPATILGGKALVSISGPGVGDGGITVWSLSSRVGADLCTYPSSATWYVGPIANSPLASRLNRVGITSTAWSYGVSGAACRSSSPFREFDSGNLIGVSQAGNAITIASFSTCSGCGDSSVPSGQISFTLVP